MVENNFFCEPIVYFGWGLNRFRCFHPQTDLTLPCRIIRVMLQVNRKNDHAPVRVLPVGVEGDSEEDSEDEDGFDSYANYGSDNEVEEISCQ